MNARGLLFRVAAGLLCAAPGLWVMSPVLLARHYAVPGVDPGDNLAALWNVWWFVDGTRAAGWPYWTPLLFAPTGTQLALHTHATTHAVLASVWVPFTSLPAAHNIAITLGLVLNGLMAFALAVRVTGHVVGAVAAGILFAASAAVQIRTLGHINLVHAWVLPLFAVALSHLMARPGAWRGVLLGCAGALVIYTDYYYTLYAVLLAVLWTMTRGIRGEAERLPARTGRAGTILLALMALDLAVIGLIAVTGGTTWELGFAQLSLRGLRNPVTLFWFLGAAWLLWRYPWRLNAGWRAARPTLRDATPLLIAAAIFVLLALPLLAALARVIAAGDYTTQTVLWRSSPPGADLLTVLLGHPRHALTGEWTRSRYTALGIDVMEQSLWLGIIPLVAVVWFAREWRHTEAARIWLVAAAGFALLCLGPFLRAGGIDFALPLPDALLRYLPVFSNARIPGRAVVMVQLAVAMLFACAIARRSGSAATLLLVLVVAESLPAQLPIYTLPAPDAVDEVLKTSSSVGSVAELPLGLRDGFTNEGSFDHRALVHQMSHRRALVGGFVARLAPGVRRAYADEPLLQSLVGASRPSGPDYRLGVATGTRAYAAGIAFVVVNRDTFIDLRLPRHELERAGFRFVVAAGPRELYETRREPANH